MQHPLPEIHQASEQLFEVMKSASHRGVVYYGTEPIDLDEGTRQNVIRQIMIWRESYPTLDTFPRNPDARPLTYALAELQSPLPLTYGQVQRAYDQLVTITLVWDDAASSL